MRHSGCGKKEGEQSKYSMVAHYYVANPYSDGIVENQ